MQGVYWDFKKEKKNILHSSHILLIKRCKPRLLRGALSILLNRILLLQELQNII